MSCEDQVPRYTIAEQLLDFQRDELAQRLGALEEAAMRIRVNNGVIVLGYAAEILHPCLSAFCARIRGMSKMDLTTKSCNLAGLAFEFTM